MKLLLVRHGETFANDAQRWSGSQDLDITNLTENGKNQAKKLGSWFKDTQYMPTHIYVSPQKRALDTYKLAGTHWNIKPSIVNELKETSAGNFKGIHGRKLNNYFLKKRKVFVLVVIGT